MGDFLPRIIEAESRILLIAELVTPNFNVILIISSSKISLSTEFNDRRWILKISWFESMDYKVITCGWYKRYTYEFTFYLRNNVRRHDRMVRHRGIRRCRYSRAVRPEQWRRSEYNASHGDHVGRAWMCFRLDDTKTKRRKHRRRMIREKEEGTNKEEEGRIGKRWNKRTKQRVVRAWFTYTSNRLYNLSIESACAAACAYTIMHARLPNSARVHVAQSITVHLVRWR